MVTKAQARPAKKFVLKKGKKAPVKAGTSKQAAADRKNLFIEAYCANGGNATQAAITAGYSAKTADQQGSRLLKDVKVSAEIAERAQSVARIVGLTTERTLQEVARLAYSDVRKLFKADGTLKPIHELTDDEAAAVASVEIDDITIGQVKVGSTTKIKHWDKNSALEKAMKHHGLYEKDNEQQPAALLLLAQIATNPASRIKIGK